MAKKPTGQARSLIGTESLQLLAHIAHGMAPQVRASSGLATALHSLYAAKLEEAEADTERLGKRCGDDAGAAYTRQCHHTQELRGVVAILETLDDTLENAARRASRMEELTRRCKGGAR
jgi:uncharacterized protein YukE